MAGLQGMWVACLSIPVGSPKDCHPQVLVSLGLAVTAGGGFLGFSMLLLRCAIRGPAAGA